MDKEIFFKVLQLDSLLNILHWKERIRIHLSISGRNETTTPDIMNVFEWIVRNKWEAPPMKYGQDYLQYYYDENIMEWLPVEEYKKFYNQQFRTLWNSRMNQNWKL